MSSSMCLTLWACKSTCSHHAASYRSHHQQTTNPPISPPRTATSIKRSTNSS
ncbi:hypothetical protein BS50DRAFT_572692 [Corynespora cassiicola Philippines]|uniref:Uncharacterized protein n=1 Tax=Corynespora cassiicola Philippines TaxID=1448308 RepID=A0A2T2NQD7_CORCC|nr:hypothetical protein BS50DRAFT_572692 [Corynespora cassiicola Philippines]